MPTSPSLSHLAVARSSRSVTLPARRELVTLSTAAEHLGVCTMTVRRRISDGTLTGYRIRGSRAVRVDLAEVDTMIQTIPTVGSGA